MFGLLNNKRRESMDSDKALANKKTGIVKLAPRITEKTSEFYKKFESTNAGVEYVLEAFPGLYVRTINELQNKLTRNELMLIVDVLSEHRYNPRYASIEIVSCVADGMALHHLDEKWNIPDKWAFNKKLADLPAFERACLEIWVRLYRNQDEPRNIEQYIDGLTHEQKNGENNGRDDRKS